MEARLIDIVENALGIATVKIGVGSPGGLEPSTALADLQGIMKQTACTLAYTHADYNDQTAALLLGITHQSFKAAMKKYGIEKPVSEHS